MAKKIDKPTEEDKKLLNDIAENSVDVVELRGSKWKIGWTRHRALRMMTDIVTNEKDEHKVSSKCAAALLLNGFWKIKFFYWFLWRWFFYVKQYSDEELLPIIDMCKKKVPVTAYCAITILLTEMRDTEMVMTRAEVKRFRQESFMEQHGQSEKSTNV